MAILGAGLTGLWTAYELQRREPGLRILLLERDIAGFGASGRNGGWCVPDLNISLPMLARAVRHERGAGHPAGHVRRGRRGGSCCAEEGLDGGYVRGGALFVARGPHQLPDLHASYERYVRFGFGEHYELLDGGDARACGRRGGGGRPGHAGLGRHPPGAAGTNLARLVERRGATIHEGTAVTGFAARGEDREAPIGRPCATAHGTVRAAIDRPRRARPT